MTDLQKLKSDREADRAKWCEKISRLASSRRLDRLPARCENFNSGGDAMQLTPEELAAAERVRRIKSGHSHQVYFPNYEGSLHGNPPGETASVLEVCHRKYHEDCATLANLALRLIAADDETPADENWLRSVGFADDYDDLVIGNDVYEGMSLVSDRRDREWHIGNIRGNHTSLVRLSEVPKTRGDVRRLASALGISLQETPTP